MPLRALSLSVPMSSVCEAPSRVAERRVDARRWCSRRATTRSASMRPATFLRAAKMCTRSCASFAIPQGASRTARPTCAPGAEVDLHDAGPRCRRSVSGVPSALKRARTTSVSTNATPPVPARCRRAPPAGAARRRRPHLRRPPRRPCRRPPYRPPLIRCCRRGPSSRSCRRRSRPLPACPGLVRGACRRRRCRQHHGEWAASNVERGESSSASCEVMHGGPFRWSSRDVSENDFQNQLRPSALYGCQA